MTSTAPSHPSLVWPRTDGTDARWPDTSPPVGNNAWFVPLDEAHGKYRTYEQTAGEHLAQIMGLPKLAGEITLLLRPSAPSPHRPFAPSLHRPVAPSPGRSIAPSPHRPFLSPYLASPRRPPKPLWLTLTGNEKHRICLPPGFKIFVHKQPRQNGDVREDYYCFVSAPGRRPLGPPRVHTAPREG
jgi:hypothetical protein